MDRRSLLTGAAALGAGLAMPALALGIPVVAARLPRFDAEAAARAPHFTGRLIRGVTNGPSPAWLQQRLRAIGLRPISALVDITNLFTFDLNRPLHVFDVAKVTGDLTLNGVTRQVTLEVEITEAGAHPMTGKPVAGFDVEGKINRSEFGLGAFVPAVSDEISFDIAVEAGKG